jgi:uncharacterized integral membrane protein
MLEFLRDSIWQFIGALVGLLAIVLTIVLYQRQRQQKAFTYEVVANTRLLTVSKEIRRRVKILLDDKPVEDVRYVLLRFTNSGNVPIVPTDFVETLQVKFGGSAELLSYEITETSPTELRIELTQPGPQAIELKPLLLNAGDSFSVKLLLGQFTESMQITGRIVGVKRIASRNVENFQRGEVLRRGCLFTLTMMFILLILTVFALQAVASESPELRAYSGFLNAIIVVLYLLVGVGLILSNEDIYPFLNRLRRR